MSDSEKVHPHTTAHHHDHAVHDPHASPVQAHHPDGQVHARFQLTQYSPAIFHQSATEGGKVERIEGAYVHLNAVKGEPFGSATPNGGVQMSIANPAAAALFKNARLGQEFDVVFTPVHKQAK